MNRIIRPMFAVLVIGVAGSACHPGAVLNSDPQQVGGTIAGMVRATNGSVPLPTRRVTVIDATNGTRYDGVTGPNGGYTIKVPEGTYRIEVEVREGEAVSRQPDETRVNNGDLDSARDFEITAKAAP